MVKHGTFYVPTIDHNRYYVEYRNEYGYDEKVAAASMHILNKTWKPRGARTKRA